MPDAPRRCATYDAGSDGRAPAARRRPFIVLLLLASLGLGCDEGSVTAPGSSARCGPWPAQESSPYVLPYPAGTTYQVRQGNCTPGTHAVGSRDQYAYDLDLANGDLVVAARAGVVEELEERFEDGNGVVTEANYVLIRHDDGQASVYFHLTRNGVLVALGAPVAQGQPLALSGQTGRSGISPHLHFGVLGPAGLTVPVTFRNTTPHPNGLVQGESYPAL